MPYWRSLGCAIAPGVSEQTLASFERMHRVGLPADVREYFARCNALSPDAGGAWDHEWLGLVSFWPFEELASLDSHDKLPQGAGPARSYIMFADFLIHSHVYAMRLTAAAHTPCPVIFYGGMPYVDKLGDSFSDFVALYLQHPGMVVTPPEPLYVRP